MIYRDCQKNILSASRNKLYCPLKLFLVVLDMLALRDSCYGSTECNNAEASLPHTFLWTLTWIVTYYILVHHVRPRACRQITWLKSSHSSNSNEWNKIRHLAWKPILYIILQHMLQLLFMLCFLRSVLKTIQYNSGS